MSRRLFALFVLGGTVTTLVLAAGGLLMAAVIGGTVQKVDAKSIVVEQKSGGTKLFTVGPSADVTIDGKKAKLADVKPGQAVSITTSKAGDVTKISARGEAAAKPAEAKPEPNKGDAPSDEPADTVASTKKPGTTARSSSGRAGTGKRAGGGVEEETGWSQYRGPGRANRSAETGLLKQWPADGPEQAWTTTGLGEGYSSVSLADEMLYTMGTEGGKEVVFALKQTGGAPVWTAATNGGVFNDGNGNGPRGTPTVDGDALYALGAQGDLVCLNRADGKQRWHKNILREFGADNIVWGICESVLIDGQNLICTPGGRQGTMVALNKANGRVVWTCQVPGNPRTAYASPIIVETGGVKQYVNFVHNAVIGVDARTGNLLWGDNHAANDTANCSSPVVDGDFVFAASGYGKGGAAVRLGKSGRGVEARFLYHTDRMKNHHGGMVALDGYVYGFDDQVLTCLDIKTGKVAWQNRSVGKGAVTFADGQLYCRSENGPLALVEATPKGHQENGRFNPDGRSGKPAWAHPVVAAGMLLIRDQDRLTAFNVKQ